MAKQNSNENIILDEGIVMCSGVCCRRRTACYRFKLNSYYGFVSAEPHHDPQFVEPAYDPETDKCPFYLRPLLMDR